MQTPTPGDFPQERAHTLLKTLASGTVPDDWNVASGKGFDLLQRFIADSRIE